jgi:hypothetical protein
VAFPVWADRTVEHLANHCFYGPFLCLVTILLGPQTVLILMTPLGSCGCFHMAPRRLAGFNHQVHRDYGI